MIALIRGEPLPRDLLHRASEAPGPTPLPKQGAWSPGSLLAPPAWIDTPARASCLLGPADCSYSGMSGRTVTLAPRSGSRTPIGKPPRLLRGRLQSDYVD